MKTKTLKMKKVLDTWLEELENQHALPAVKEAWDLAFTAGWQAALRITKHEADASPGPEK